MKPKKSHIIYYFIKLRWSRLFSSNKVSIRRKSNWKKNLKSSSYYQPYLPLKTEFPIMNKSLFMQNFDLINTVGIKKEAALKIAIKSESSRDFTPSLNGISIGLSSGTSGNKGIFLTSPKEKAIWVASILERVIGFSLKKRKVAFFLRANNNLYESVKSSLLSFTFFDIKIPIEHHIEVLKNLKADIIVAQPSVLMEIAKHYKKKNINPTFNKIISVAEILETDQKENIEQSFNCPVSQVYQCTEGFLAYTCKKGQLHFNEDWLRIEKKYVDKDRSRFHPVITDYLRESQPIIRYELNDIIQEGPICDCGSKATVIQKIEGRADDVFRFYIKGKEIIIYPDFIRRAVVISSQNITNYVITLKEHDLISVYLEVKDESILDQIYVQVKDDLMTMLAGFGINEISIEKGILNQSSLDKFTRIKNEYSKAI